MRKLQTGVSAGMTQTIEIEACIERCLPLAGNDPMYRELVAKSKKTALRELANLKTFFNLEMSNSHRKEIAMMDELWPDI